MAELFSQPLSYDALHHSYERAPVPSIEDRIARMESFDTLGLQPELDYAKDFALRPITEGFNWDTLLAKAEELNGWEPGRDLTDYRLIVFRSVRKPNVDTALLNTVDMIAFRDAMYRAEERNRAFVLYLRGDADEEGNGLSACLWKRPEDATEISRSEAHRDAMLVTKATYQDVILEKHDLNRIDGQVTIDLVEVNHVISSEK